MKKKIAGLIEKSISACVAAGLMAESDLPYIEMEVPANPDHGDFSSNAAMILASRAKQNPRRLAQAILRALDREDAGCAGVLAALPPWSGPARKRSARPCPTTSRMPTYGR